MKVGHTARSSATVLAAVAFLITVTYVPTATTWASFNDRETMRANTFASFGVGPRGFTLETGTSEATWASRRGEPSEPIARPSDGSLDLDFGEVTFGTAMVSPDAFRISNRSPESRRFRVLVPSSLSDAILEAVVEGGETIDAGSVSRVRIVLNGGARPPGKYEGFIAVTDTEGEFYRVLRVEFRILGVDETEALEEAVDVEAPEGGSTDGSVEPMQVPEAPSASGTVAPEDGRPADPGVEPSDPGPAPNPEPESEPQPEPKPEPKPESAPEPEPPAPPAAPSGAASPSAG